MLASCSTNVSNIIANLQRACTTPFPSPAAVYCWIFFPAQFAGEGVCGCYTEITVHLSTIRYDSFYPTYWTLDPFPSTFNCLEHRHKLGCLSKGYCCGQGQGHNECSRLHWIIVSFCTTDICVDVLMPKDIPSTKWPCTDDNTMTYSITRHTVKCGVGVAAKDTKGRPNWKKPNKQWEIIALDRQGTQKTKETPKTKQKQIKAWQLVDEKAWLTSQTANHQLGHSKVCAQRVFHILTAENKRVWVVYSKALLQISDSCYSRHLDETITGNKTWVQFYEP